MHPDKHEIFRRRRSRNLGLGLVLGAFAALSFAVTVVRLDESPSTLALDPIPGPEMLPAARE